LVGDQQGAQDAARDPYRDEHRVHADADQQVGRLPVVLPQLVTRGDIPPTATEVDRGDNGRFIVPKGDLFAPKGIDTTCA
jgi:hypothetical protein